jgi:nucleoside-triphosphatase THEP1
VGKHSLPLPVAQGGLRSRPQPHQAVAAFDVVAGIRHQVIEGSVFARARGGASTVDDFEVDLELLNTCGVALLELAADAPLVVLDEPGVLEAGTARYADAMAGLCRRHSKVPAVVQQRALSLWTERLGDERPYELFELNAENRDELPAAICATMARALR